jgi:hypothetical protein
MSKKRKICEGSPVKYKSTSGAFLDFPIRFKWQEGLWFNLFEQHVEFIAADIERPRAEGRLIMYLSCPISVRGGGHSITNVEIASHTANRLQMKWGSRLWVLNPALYQMESKAGTGLIRRHARTLELKLGLEKDLGQGYDIDALYRENPPLGGDYLRMWARVLIEDGAKNLGGRFDGFYFMGPNDMWHFFSRDGQTPLTEGIEQYFSQKFNMDADFHAYFGGKDLSIAERQKRRDDFFRFYAMRASAAYSLGSHDEYNIWCSLNRLRIKDAGVDSQIAGYFDGRALDLSVPSIGTIPGYALLDDPEK